MNKIFSKFTNCGFGIFFALTILLSLYRLAESLKYSAAASVATAIFIAAVAVGLNIIFTKLKTRLDNVVGGDCGEKKADRIFLALALILLAAQCAFACLNEFKPTNDLSYLCTAAQNLVRNGADSLYDGLPMRHRHYFAVYPNNHMLFLIIALLYKIQYTLTGEITNTLPIAINILGLNLSYILAYKCAKLIYSPSQALVCAVKGLMFTPLITYSMYFYTDSMGMPWLVGALYLYLKWRNEKSRGTSLPRQIATLVACGLILAVGYKIKGSAIILIPAIILDLLFTQKGLKAKLLPIVPITLVFAAAVMIIASTACAVMNISDEELDKYEFPSVHWVMMSSDGRGGYNREDFDYTKSFDGYDHKTEADIDRLKEKVTDQGASGFLNHLMHKLTYTWKNGTFMISYYMTHSDLLASYAFVIISSCCHFTLLISMAKSYLSKIKSDNDVQEKNFILKVTLMGLTVFLLIWEARCRYLVSFFPLFALL